MNVTFISKAGIISLATLVFLLPSCSQDSLESITAQEEVPNEEDVITAVFAGSETRTSYSNNAGTNFSWDDGDEIRLAFSNADSELSSVLSARGELTPYSDETRAMVTYDAPASGMIRNFFAVYPYDLSEIEYYGGSIYLQVTLKDTYEPGEWSSDYCPIPMYAINDEHSNKLNFQHFCGLLRVNCQNVPIGTSKLIVRPRNSSDNLSGVLQFRWDNSVSDWWYSGLYDGKNTISYKLSEAVSGPSQSFVINIPLNVFTSSATSRTYGFLEVVALDESDNQVGLQLFDMGTPLEPGQGCHGTVDFSSLAQQSFTILLGGTSNQTSVSTSSTSLTSAFVRENSLFRVSSGTLYRYKTAQNESITLTPGTSTQNSNSAYLDLSLANAYQYKGPLTIRLTCESEGESVVRLLSNTTSGYGSEGTTVKSSDGLSTIEFSYTSTETNLSSIRIVVPQQTSSLKIYSIEVVLN